MQNEENKLKERNDNFASSPFFIFSIFSILLIFLFSDGSFLSGEAALKETCVTDKCHSTMGKEKFIHGPVSTGDCEFCHKTVGKHKFEPIKNLVELCYRCHDRLNTMKSVHDPVKNGYCTGCHNPHQSPNKFQLVASGADLCFKCHNKSIIDGKFVHGPAAVGSCSTCHDPHQSDFPKMLFASGNDVCVSCHSDKFDDFKTKKFMHAPVKDNCVNCHNPHSGNYKYSLSAEGDRDLCFACHADKEKEIAEAKVKHGGLEGGKKCLGCHDPHVSNYVKQLIMQPADLCLSCHDREYTNANGKVANMKAYLENNKIVHGPIKQKDCSSCHNAHGSNNFRMLREYYPPVFYASYDPNNYKLCFMCHEKALATEERTTTLTGFRNGDLNLHYVHVNKQQKGRTCRVCHDAHATNNPSLIRDAVPFGTWNLPINFAKTENGGRCLPGCHQLFQYDRNKMIVNR